MFTALFILLLIRWGYLEYAQFARRAAARHMREVAREMGSSAIKKDVNAADLREAVEATIEAIL